MNVSHYETVVSHVNGVVAEKPTWLNELNEYRVHAAWKLGQCGTDGACSKSCAADAQYVRPIAIHIMSSRF